MRQHVLPRQGVLGGYDPGGLFCEMLWPGHPAGPVLCGPADGEG
jgi:hypothetical protein